MLARQIMRDQLFLEALKGAFATRDIEIEHTLDLFRFARELNEKEFEAVFSAAWAAASNRAGPRHTKTIKGHGGTILIQRRGMTDAN